MANSTVRGKFRMIATGEGRVDAAPLDTLNALTVPDLRGWRTMEKLLWIVLAGGAGTAARYGIVTLFGRFNATGSFPWAIFTANMIGCYLFGIVWQAAEDRSIFNDHVRLAVLVGFLGAFTTFSTFAFDNAQLIKDGRWGELALNIALNNAVGIALVFAGFRTSRALWN